MMKTPVVELSDCILCEVCRCVCPSVFHLNDSGFIQVIPMEHYPEDEVAEAIKNCPSNCIQWEDV
ncbi:MAG: ferredoxin [Desulfobacteraceae bacterium]|nr:ferredoxin [Desulfobacteraceae bacterium]